MNTNTAFTLFNRAHKATRKEAWHPVFFPAVSAFITQAASLRDAYYRADVKAANQVIIRLPLTAAPTDKTFVLPNAYALLDEEALASAWTIQPGDLALLGNFEEPNALSSISSILEQYSDQCFTVNAWRDNRRGSIAVQHWRIEGA